MVEMARKEILPAVTAYASELADTALKKKQLSAVIDTSMEEELVEKLSKLTGVAFRKTKALEDALCAVREEADPKNPAMTYKDFIIPAMNELRIVIDELETLTAEDHWPYPTYGDLLFGIR